MNIDLDSYIGSHTAAEPDHLARLYRRTQLTRLYPRMCTDHVQGRLLKMLTAMIRPQRVLELGTFAGYSTLCIAEGLEGDACVHTLEVDDEHADDLRQLFAASPGGSRISLHIGDALELVTRLEGGWDMVYIDANKRQYVDYFNALLPRMAPGGYILADNTLWSGKVADSACKDPQTEALRAFNDLVASDPRVETVILPVRDGLSLIRVTGRQSNV